MTRRFSGSVSMMFREAPLLERFSAARSAGFVGVEIQMLAEGDPAEMAEAARRAGIAVTLINVGMGDYLMGGAGLSGVPGREAEFAAALEVALSAAMALRPAFIHIGPSRTLEGGDRAQALATYAANIALAVERARFHGVDAALLVEPMNRVEAPTALLNDIDDAAAFLREHFGDKVGLLFDIYHVAMNGADPIAAFTRHRDLVRHVQFSDVPGRKPPGQGTLDFAALFAGLEAEGYAGLYGAEYLPGGSTPDSLGWMERLARAG